MNTSQKFPTALDLGHALRKRRKTLGINMVAAAEAAKMSRFTWHKLEKGDDRVALAYLLAAARVLGLECRLALPGEGEAGSKRLTERQDWLPMEIRLADYPGLQRLAWQLRKGVETLTPRQAWELYERNERHLDKDRLQPGEKSLMRTLRRIFGGDSNDV